MRTPRPIIYRFKRTRPFRKMPLSPHPFPPPFLDGDLGFPAINSSTKLSHLPTPSHGGRRCRGGVAAPPRPLLPQNLARHRVAPFGGPIAAIRDDSKIVQLYAESACRKLHIFNSAGVLLASAVWDRPGGRLVGMAWTDDQSLVCVVQDGTVYRYDLRAELSTAQFSMGKECFEQGVVECVFLGNGMICLTEDRQTLTSRTRSRASSPTPP